jgi:hypothetical protein
MIGNNKRPYLALANKAQGLPNNPTEKANENSMKRPNDKVFRESTKTKSPAFAGLFIESLHAFKH